MRLFIAVEIPEKTKDELEKILRPLKAKISQELKWVPRANWHFTLKFLGETNPRSINDLKASLNELQTGWQQKALTLGGIAAFPNLNTPQVIFFNLKKGQDYLQNFHSELEEKLIPLGFPAERRKYIPHLTLARAKPNSNLLQLQQELKSFKDLSLRLQFFPEKISLIKSVLYPTSPKYENIHSIFLK